jgi:hypothetical protein
MRDHRMTIYPDVSDIFARKAAARKENARLSFAEKIAIIEAMRERAAPFRRARERRLATQEGPQVKQVTPSK